MAILNTLAITIIFLADFSIPVMLRRYITGPQSAFRTEPIAKTIRGETPPEKSSPKNSKINFGKMRIRRKRKIYLT